MSTVPTDHLLALGQEKDYQFGSEPEAALLERFPNPFTTTAMGLAVEGGVGTLHIEAPEFTSLCPLTAQPDFATIVIDYRPLDWCVESKSLKLYLGSFRMVGEFHESCVARIGRDLIRLLDPKELVVEGRFTPRGGIPFWPRLRYYRPKSAPGLVKD